jgi:hypothetical protein
MNELEHQDLPADEQLRRAFGGVAGIFEQLLRRNDGARAEIERTRDRHNEDVARMAALEMSLAADRAAIQQIGGVFAKIAQHAPAPAAEPASHDHQPARTVEPAGHPPIGATATADAADAPASNGRMSTLTAADLVALSRKD